MRCCSMKLEPLPGYFFRLCSKFGNSISLFTLFIKGEEKYKFKLATSTGILFACDNCLRGLFPYFGAITPHALFVSSVEIVKRNLLRDGRKNCTEVLTIPHSFYNEKQMVSD